MFGESIDSSVDISLTLIGMRIHWPTLTIIRCRWFCNRLQYLKLCASSLFFSSLSWRLVAPEEMDWLSSVMILNRIQYASCSCMYCRTFLIFEKLWFRISSKDYGHAVVQGVSKNWKQLSLSIVQTQYNYGRTVTLMLLSFFFASLKRVNARHRW